MRYEIHVEPTFKRDYKKIKKRGYDKTLLEAVIEKLAGGETLAPKHRDHQLRGKLRQFRECHIKDDWLLVYKIEKEKLVLCLVYTGTHADLFDD